MILEEATKEAFGYYPSALKLKSHKRVLATCDDCGKIRTTSKNGYYALCKSCSQKGKIHTEEWKAKMSAAQKGRKHSKEQNVQQSKAIKGDKNRNFCKRGAECDNYKGGSKVSNARRYAKRRGLGHISLNTSFGGCECHHITHNYVVYIPAYLHKSVYHNLNTCQGMEAINSLALDLLVNGV